MDDEKRVEFQIKGTKASLKLSETPLCFDTVDAVPQKIINAERKTPLVIPLPSKPLVPPPEPSKHSTEDSTKTESKSSPDSEEQKPFLYRYGLIKSKTAKERPIRPHLIPLGSQRPTEINYFEDVAKRPEPPTQAAYEAVPIEQFGAAMLRGMGWKSESESKSTYMGPIPRPERLGLGAESKISIATNEHQNNTSSSSKIHRPSSDQKSSSLPVRKLEKGTRVTILKGPHSGLNGIIEGIENDFLIINMDSSLVTVRVGKNDVEDRYTASSDGKAHISTSMATEGHSGSDPSSLKKNFKVADFSHGSGHYEKKFKSSKSGIDAGEYKYPPSTTGDHRYHNDKKASTNGKISTGETEFWIMENIKIRIVSKKYARGKYYCKKGVIKDVLSGTRCVVKVDDGPTLDDVEQEDMETVIPQKGGQVIVVRGPDRGIRGTVVSCDDKNQTVNIYTHEDFAFKVYSMDDVAQYTVE